MIEPSSSIPVPIEGLSLADIEQIVLATESHSDEIWTRRVAVALKARVDTALSRLAGELREAQRDGDRHWGEMSQISDAIGSTRFMDPPDGGSPTLAEQVGRMRETLVAAESRATALAAEVERLTRERDDERSNHRRTVEAMEFEQRDTEAALGREGEALRDMEDRANKLEAQVKRLIAKEAAPSREKPTPVPIEGLVERLQARDREWQEHCDRWVAQIRESRPDEMTPELEATLRKSTDAEAASELSRLAWELRHVLDVLDMQRDNYVAAESRATALAADVERLTYELKRWGEATAKRPDWEKLWAEQADRAEAAEASLSEALKVLEPFALISSDGVIGSDEPDSYVTVVTQAEYFHRAARYLAAQGPMHGEA